MTIRFGLVGAGRWGACHAEAIRRTPGAELAAVAVSTPESARRIVAALGAPAFVGWDELETGDLRAEIARIVGCVRDGERPPADADDGRWAVRLALAAEESARSGREVTL